MKRPLLGILSAVIAGLVVGGVGPSAVAAPLGVADFDFESFSGDYYLDVDASGHAITRVVETIVARFPEIDQNRGIIRAIPLTDGDYPLDVTMLSVLDENGDPVYFERNDSAGFAEFALGTDEFVHGRVTYVLEYTMKNTIRHFADTRDDEFYWDINGTGWAQSFDTVSARIFLSPALAQALTGAASCYAGTYGAVGECTMTRADGGFSTSVGPVYSYGTLTVAIGFAGGTVTQPQLPRDSWIVTIAPKVLLGLAVLVLLIAIVLRLALWRDARGRGTIIAQFEPPEVASMFLNANLIDRNGAALAAQFVDFAVRGIVNIIDTRAGKPVRSDATRFEIQLVTTDGASSDELKVLVIMFGKELTLGMSVNPGMMGASKGAALYSLPTSTGGFAVSRGFRAQPPGRWSSMVGRVGVWLVLGFIPIWIWASVLDVLEGNVLLPAFGTVGLAVIVPIVLAKPRLLTRKGAEAKEYLLGMRVYLTVAEEERMRVLQSPEGAQRVNANDHGAVVGLNERLLGYAVLWGVEDQWARQLKADYGSDVPSWLASDSFDASMLRSFAYATTSSVRPIASSSSSGGSSWSSSGGSSFSGGSGGGGFSGGGGGGGGGGGR